MTMSSTGLRKLHELHLKLREVQEKLEKGPKQVKTRQQIVEKKGAEVDAQSAAYMQLRVAADQKNLQLKTNESKIAQLQIKLNQASSNREYDVIQSQIDADRMANSVLEDEILEALEKVDQAKIAVGKLEQEVADAKKGLDQLSKDIGAAEAPLREEAVRLEAAVREAETELPQTIIEHYRRLVTSHGAGALAAVENRACTECYAQLAPQDLVSVNTGKFHFCRICGRLL
ncbi:MAG TPA: hypothetical protein VNC50_15375, partial [Planctomycetia bacterium]|nr:hypothetical protein [Planctomycetia bacterium]